MFGQGLAGPLELLFARARAAAAGTGGFLGLLLGLLLVLLGLREVVARAAHRGGVSSSVPGKLEVVHAGPGSAVPLLQPRAHCGAGYTGVGDWWERMNKRTEQRVRVVENGEFDEKLEDDVDRCEMV